MLADFRAGAYRHEDWFVAPPADDDGAAGAGAGEELGREVACAPLPVHLIVVLHDFAGCANRVFAVGHAEALSRSFRECGQCGLSTLGCDDFKTGPSAALACFPYI